MTISTDDTIFKFGTQDNIDDGSTAAVNDDAYSEACSWTNDDDAPFVSFIFQGQYPSGTLDSSPFLAIYARLLNVDGTDDEAVPDSGHAGHYLGNLHLDSNLAATTNTWSASRMIALPAIKSSQAYEFYFHNNTGVQISANWTLDVVPQTFGPKAA